MPLSVLSFTHEPNNSPFDGRINAPACEPVLPVDLDPEAEQERIDEFFDSWIDFSELDYGETITAD